MTLTIIGGDKKSLYLSKYFKEMGHSVFLCGLERLNNSECITIKNAAEISDFAILPLPTSRDNIKVFAPYSEKEITLIEIYDCFNKTKVLYGGKNNFDFENYYTEPLMTKNAVPTAEGAIMTAIDLSERTLWNSNCIVVGYGKIGKILSFNLKSLGSKVTVTARRDNDIALASSFGFNTAETYSLESIACDADFIFNTVPYPVITKDVIRKLKKHCVIIDLASKPGGTDFKAAEELSITSVLALNLPSLTAPDTAAKLIAEHINFLISERVKL